MPYNAPIACLIYLTLFATSIHAGEPTPDTIFVPYGSANVSYLEPSILGISHPPSANQFVYDPAVSLNQPDFATQWYQPAFDMDVVQFAGGERAEWKHSAALPIGYGDIGAFSNGLTGHEGLATDLILPDSGQRYATYLRIPLTIPDSVTSPAYLAYVVDDGAALYLDGQPLARINCCLDGTTPVADGSPVGFDNLSTGIGNETRPTVIPLEGLTPGDHLLAISLHNSSPTSSDTGLDFRIYSPGNYSNWTGQQSSRWHDDRNWVHGVPSPNDFAVLSDGTSGVIVDEQVTLEGIQFQNGSFVLTGTGAVDLTGRQDNNASLNVSAASIDFQVDVELSQDTDAMIETVVDFNNQLQLNGNRLKKTGVGELRIDNKANTGTGVIDVASGILSGSGTIAGDVIVSGGLLSPVASRNVSFRSTLTINGNATIQSGGIRLAVYGDEDNDAVAGGGSGVLNLNTAEFDLAERYQPLVGDSALLFPGWEEIQGELDLPFGWTFDASTGRATYDPLGEFLDCDIDRDNDCDLVDIDRLVNSVDSTPESIEVWLAEAGPANGFAEGFRFGDSNLDGKIDASDLNTMGRNWQATRVTWSTGDYNGDDVVNSMDLNLLAQNWQSVLPLASPVPEPSAACLFICVCIGAFGLRRSGTNSA